MTWQKGQSGNPSGNRQAKGQPMSGTTWMDIFEAIMAGTDKELPNTPKKQIIKKALSAARQGKPWAVKYLMNHGMGMPTQKTILTGVYEGPVRLIIGGNDDRQDESTEDETRAAGSDGVIPGDPED